MKKISFLLAMVFVTMAFSQVTVSPTNPTINDLITVTYTKNATTGWSYLDPGGDSVLYLYLGLDTDNNLATWEYNDMWNNCSAANLIPMVYSIDNSTVPATEKFSATFDLRAHNFDGIGGVLPVGTTVYNGKYVIRRANTYECAPSGAPLSSWQGPDENFGITQAVVIMGVNETKTNPFKANVVGGNLYIEKAGSYKVKVYDATGKLLETFSAKNGKTPLNTKNNSLHFCVIEDVEGNQQNIKFIR